jgi:glycosyltransferase involved in cell wall biosynthesis
MNKIGLNLLFLLPGETGGIQTHALALLRELSLLDRRNRYFIFLNQECHDLVLDLPSNFMRINCPIRASNRFVRYAWEQFVLPVQAGMLNLDILHSLAYVGPLCAPCSTLVTTHDANFMAWGGSMGWLRRVAMGSVSFALAHRADYVFTVSAFSRQELVSRLWLRPRKVLVIPNAVDANEFDREASPDTQVERYIVAFAGGDQNKNIPRLLEAFTRLADQIPHRLWLIGRIPDYVGTVIASLPERIQRRVHCPGYMERAIMTRTLLEAEAFVFPSYYEGFGLPILEAHAAGIPVVCSQAASLPEVAGAAAVYFDPYSVAAMADALMLVLSDSVMRDRLRDAGYRNLRRYSWARSARLLLSTYSHMAGDGGCGGTVGQTLQH